MDLLNTLKEWKNFRKTGVPSDSKNAAWKTPFDTLRKKWDQVPTRAFASEKTSKLVALSDKALLEEWENTRQNITTGPEFTHRGWYHALYAPGMCGKKVMDVGSGFGVDSITFAQHGAKLTFVDLVETNLKVLCKIMNLANVRFVLLEDLESLRPLDTDYDVIMAMGSLHHAPTDILKPEYQELLRHLKCGGGRWLQLAYPRSRWIREGRSPFSKWGEITDGPGTPWSEWLEPDKLLGLLAPGKFDLVFYQEFHHGYFNWFDLLYRGM